MWFTLWPGGKVNLLVTLQVRSVRLGCMSLKLHRLLSGPSHDKGANGPSNQIGYFREDLTVSKMISSCAVIAMPTSADCGVPSKEMLDTTPKRCRTMNACKAIRSIVEPLNLHRNYSPHRYDGCATDRVTGYSRRNPQKYGSVRIGDHTLGTVEEGPISHLNELAFCYQQSEHRRDW
jgi:hypothetical protein